MASQTSVLRWECKAVPRQYLGCCRRSLTGPTPPTSLRVRQWRSQLQPSEDIDASGHGRACRDVLVHHRGHFAGHPARQVVPLL